MEKHADDENNHAAEAVVSHHDFKDSLATTALQQEHELTLQEVIKNHKVVVWWCFYWAMCAIGW
jgi:hypothetical protein